MEAIDKAQLEEFQYDMEQRMTKVEHWKEAMQVEMVERLMEQVCNRINLNPMAHLPKVGKLMMDHTELQKNFDRKIEQDAYEAKEK